MERASLTIDGMTCGHCVHAVDRALKGIEGVQVERVDLGSAVVAYDPATVKPGQIREAITEEGYELRDIARAP